MLHAFGQHKDASACAALHTNPAVIEFVGLASSSLAWVVNLLPFEQNHATKALAANNNHSNTEEEKRLRVKQRASSTPHHTTLDHAIWIENGG
jgi:hypothetical protein